MSRLEKLKEIIDKTFAHFEFTQYDRDIVYQKIEERKKIRRRYTIGGSIAAVACVAVVVVLTAIPALNIVQLKRTTAVSSAENHKGIISGDVGMSENQDLEKIESLDYEKITVTPLSALGSGLISTDSGFYVDTSDSPMDAETASEMFSIEPDIPYVLSIENENLFFVSTEEPLPDSSIVKLSIGSEDQKQYWAFQTKRSMTVVSSIPGDGMIGMPLNTGIEIGFSCIVDSNAKDYFEISPDVRGEIRLKGKTMIFIPEKDLEKDTVYTVTLKKGLKAASGEELEENYSFSFRTPFDYSSDYEYLDCIGDINQSYIPGENITFSVSASPKMIDMELDLDIYRFSGAEEYLSFLCRAKDMIDPVLGASRDVKLDVSDRQPYIATKTSISQVRSSEYMYTDVVILPELDVGWYLAAVSTDTSTLYKFIQVTPVSVYCQEINNEIFLWLNSAVSGQPIENAKIIYTIDGKDSSTKSDKNGTAFISYNDENSAAVLIESIDGLYADVLHLSGDTGETMYKNYYSLVYLDRSVYLPTDTVSFFGNVQMRTGMAIPKMLDVCISSPGSEHKRLMSVPVSESGMFTGSIDISNHTSGYTCLYFEYNGETVIQTYFNVYEYTKPAYIMDVSLDKDFYRRSDDFKALINMNFYDGTPASGALIKTVYEDNAQTVTAADDGKAEVVFSPQIESPTSWNGMYVYVSASLTGAEDVYVSGYASAKYFPSDIMLTAQYDKETDTIKLHANDIDFSALSECLNDYYDNMDLIRGKNASVSGTINYFKHYYEKVPTGYYYDEVEKRRVDTFDYVYKKDLVYSENFTTQNGQFITEKLNLTADDCWYSAEIDYTDSFGTSLRENCQISFSNFSGSGSYYFELKNGDHLMNIGDRTDLALYDPDGNKVTGGSMLCSLVTDRVISYDIVENGEYSVNFTKQCVPNVRLASAYFDGKYIYSIPVCWFDYDTAEKKLDISIETPREEYAPGADVEVCVSVLDANGKPVESDFVLAVVDEAVFSIMEHTADPLADFYRNIYVAKINQKTSYTGKRDGMVAEGGGEGGSEMMRDDFKDIAAFITGKTDASGKAYVKFTLPENLTSWRLTTVAVADEVRAGSAVRNIYTSLDYFVNLVLDDSYTAGDDIALSARVYGIEKGRNVDYKLYLDGEYVRTVTGITGEYTFVNLGKLEAGEYEIGVRAVCGDREDGILRTVSVKTSRHSFVHYEKGVLKNSVELGADRYPASIIFYDSANGVYITALSALTGSSTNRVDGWIASCIAYDKLAEYGTGCIIERPCSVSWQNYDGAVRLMPYASPDAFTTAMTLVVGGDYIDNVSAQAYLEQVISDYNSDSVSIAAAYMGLAALGEPVLSDIRILMEEFASDSEEYYYLNCALALIGDKTLSANNYNSIFGGKIQTDGEYLYIKGDGKEDSFELTAKAVFLASLLGKSDAEAMTAYLLDKQDTQCLPFFEISAFIKNYHVRQSDSSFSCNWNGKDTQFSFDDKKAVILQFDKEELENADFSINSGEVSYIALYSAGIKADDVNANGQISISLEPSSSQIAVGENLDLTVTFVSSGDCSDSLFTADIVLPSCVRYTGYEYKPQENYMLIFNENNRLRFAFSGYEHDGPFKVSFKIHTAAVLPGSYVIEEAVAQAPMSSLLAACKRADITVK